MMRFRSVSAILAAVYIALPGGALGVRPCAHHDGAAARTAAGAESDARDHGPQDRHHGHAPAHSGSAGVGHATGLSPSESDTGNHGGCSCLDACAASGAMVLHTASAVHIGYASDRTDIAQPPAAAVTRTPRFPHFLPYPHGPPFDIPV